jgi:hypothetical protein
MSPTNVTAPTLTGLQAPTTLPALGTGSSLGNSIGRGQTALNQLNATPVAQTTPTTQGPSGLLGILSRLAPTVGAIALPTIADLATGGLAIPADMALAGAGGAAGQAIQNVADKKGAIGTNDLTTGLETAAGQGAGELLGKGLQAGGQFLTDQATKAAADQVPSELDEATAIKNNYGGTKPGVQSANNMADNLDLMQQWGLDHTDPNAMQQASNGGLFINNIDNTALATGQPIETPSLLSGGGTNLVNSVIKSTPEEQQALTNAGLMNQYNAVPESVTPVEANRYAQELNAQLRDVRATMDNAQANGRVADYNAAKTQYSKLQSIYDNVQSKISTPEVDSTIAARTISPQEKQTLVGTYGQQEADHIENAVNSAQTHTDLVKAKLPFAQMNTISKQALGDMQAPATARGVARVKQASIPPDASKAPGILGKLPMNARGIGEISGLLDAIKGHPGVGIPMAMASAATGSPAALGAGGSILSSLGDSSLPGAAGALVGGSPSTIAPAQGGATPMPPMQGNLQDSALAVALNDALSQARVQSQYPFMPNSGSISSVLPTLIQGATQAGAAQTQAGNLENMLGQAGGAQGPVMGLLSQLGQTFTGGPASLLNNQLGAQTQATGQAMSAAGAPTGAMPSITENPETANQALIGIRNLLSTLGGGQYSPTLGSL